MPRIDPTWVAWSFEQPPPAEVIEDGLERVRAHYSETAERPLVRSAWLGSHHGTATLGDPELGCRWPYWVEDGELVAAFAYVPVGWQRLVGWMTPETAAAPLAHELWQRPERASEELDAPLAIALAEPRSGRMVIVNDRFGGGRVYELRTDDGWVWSNRLGALSLFAGLRPQADRRGWALLAAGGWFMSDSTAISGARKAPAGALIEVSGPEVRHRQTAAVGRLVAPGADLAAFLDAAAEQAVDVARAADLIYPARPKVDLSGGRDSRVGAAAVIAAGVSGRFWTSDMNPGEGDIARQLAAAAPVEMEHTVTRSGKERMRTGVHVRERARNNHLLHDGMMHASTVKSNTVLPVRGKPAAQVAGHGGELAHGFYYKSGEQAERIRERGERGLIGRLQRSCRRRHKAGRKEIYEESRAVWEQHLATGRDFGLDGPVLLDWCYMMDRFAHRSGLAGSTERVGVFATPGFIGAAFALTPQQRGDALVHRELVARLVPEWNEVPFFKRQWTDVPPVRRERLWEGENIEPMEEMLRDESAWGEMFKPELARELFSEARRGEGHVHYEDVFERIAYRVAFDDHLALLGERATKSPARV